MKKKTSAMGIVFYKKHSHDEMDVLLLQNNENEWVLPKGHVEKGENEVQTAIREVEEETKVIISNDEHLGFVTEFSFYFDGEKALKVIRVHCFLTKKQQTIVPNSSEGFIDGNWFPVKDAINKLSHDDARNALKIAINLNNK
ncbi:MAG: NUDIX domain-containing protein [Candidatus Magasanikbacteria bacterium]